MDVVVSHGIKRETTVPMSDVTKELRTRSLTLLSRVNPNGSRPVKAEVAVSAVYIANAAAGLFLGSSSSSINGEVTLVDAKTGERIGDAFRVFGVTEPRPTIIGAAAIKPPRTEVSIITSDFARRMKVAIYGE